MARMKLFYAPGACSLASHIAMEEAGADFEAVRIDTAGGQQRTPDYLAINPKGRVPALADGDFIVTENPAILRYIAVTHPDKALWPSDPRGEARCAEWLAFLASGVHPTYAHIRRAERYASTQAGRTDVVETGTRATREIYQMVENKLAAASEGWAAGDGYTVADPYLLVFWTWGNGPVLGYDMAADYPHWTAHARRVLARPATVAAFEREGLALPQPRA
ncbi:glutathione binding-like protein [Aurantimonas sp. 22II-16-19i]|uniref:glutathione S-transferase family protein n=1 Tax=Aurantimonas sp. 22II-16-19i TaxID=1317114 RepID=UPI0009F7FEAF|nr:glutathione binding-like protein [Aurantimonas sp. 22II-16-19i]ORE87939.1 glutathione S-transferase domain-containing protein [Aurantimonas sp. 22II-16-19i]